MDDNTQQPDDPGQDHDPTTPDDSQMHDSAEPLEPDPERLDFMLAECKAGRFFQFLKDEPDPDLLDLCAMVRALRADDLEGVATVLRNCEPLGVIASAIKVLAEVCEDTSLSDGWFTVWASKAQDRHG